MVDRNRDQDVDRNVVADVEYAELGPTVQRKVGEPSSTAAPPRPRSPTRTCSSPATTWAPTHRRSSPRAPRSPKPK
jgi:hypothetical protein